MRCRGTRDDGSATSAPVVELSGARDVVVSNLGRSVSLQADGTVRAWGLGGFGLLDVPPAPERCGSAGCSARPVAVPELTGVTQLALSVGGGCALRRDGVALCWGSTPGLPSSYAMMPTVVSVPGGVRDVVATALGVLLRRVDGALLGGSSPGRYGASIPTGWALAGGQADYLCAVLPDATVRCWGADDQGQRGGAADDDASPVDPGLDCVRSVARTDSHTCALRTDGTVWCWGSNGLGQCGAAADANALCPDGRSDLCVLSPRRVEGIDHVESVFVGATSSCALRSDRTLWCWGGSYETLSGSPTPSRSDL